MVELLIGPICSGKSTYARLRAEQGAVIVNNDAIVQAVHSGDYTLYDKSLRPVYTAAELAIMHTALAMGRDVVVDRTNHDVKTRRRYISLAHAFDQPVAGVVFRREDPEVHARRRFEADSRGIPLERWVQVAGQHEVNYRPPALAEGFDQFYRVDMRGGKVMRITLVKGELEDTDD